MFIYEEWRGEKRRAKNEKGALETRRKKKEFILHQRHNTLACIGIGNGRGVFAGNKRRILRMSEIYLLSSPRRIGSLSHTTLLVFCIDLCA
jgi:hypothetical protein